MSSGRAATVLGRDQLVGEIEAIGEQASYGRLHRLRKLPFYDKAAVAAAVLVVLIAVVAPLVVNGVYDAVADPFERPSLPHPFGTDDAGRDVLARCLVGLRYSLIGAALVILSGVLIGGLIGLAAGVGPRWLDSVLMRLTDLFLALPAPLIAIAVVAAIEPSFAHTLMAVAIVWWPLYARVIRGETRALSARPHMEAARISGVSTGRRIRRHLLPGLVSPVIVLISLDVGGLVITLASLSFLGLGAPAPTPELGAMAAQGVQYLLSDWWVAVFPGLSVLLLALVANSAGDAIRDAVTE